MKTTRSEHAHPQTGACRQTRLAQSPLAAVDVCDCGMMHVHVGPVTLRLARCAISDLIETLNRAVVADAARDSGGAVPFKINRRGEA